MPTLAEEHCNDLEEPNTFGKTKLIAYLKNQVVLTNALQNTCNQ